MSVIYANVTLNTAEKKLAEYLAKARLSANRAKGVVDRKVGPQSGWETDLEGIAAEIAFARMMNTFPDTSTDTRPDWDVAVNFRLGDAEFVVTVDVKATTYPKGKLLAVPRKLSKPPMAYALMIGRFPTYRLAGTAPAALLLQPSKLGDLGRGTTYLLQQRELLPWAETVRIVLGFPR